MDIDLTFLLTLPIFTVLLIVVAGILIDTLFGIFNAIKQGEFDIRELPRFLATSLFPYVGGLLVLALVAQYVGPPFEYLFYAVALAVLAKYVAEITDKLKSLFGIELPH